MFSRGQISSHVLDLLKDNAEYESVYHDMCIKAERLIEALRPGTKDIYDEYYITCIELEMQVMEAAYKVGLLHAQNQVTSKSAIR